MKRIVINQRMFTVTDKEYKKLLDMRSKFHKSDSYDEDEKWACTCQNYLLSLLTDGRKVIVLDECLNYTVSELNEYNSKQNPDIPKWDLKKLFPLNKNK